MSRVLVTGASGFIGAGLLPLLAERGHTLVAIARQPPPAALAPLATWHEADIARPEGLPADALRGVQAVVHLAAIAHSDPRDTPETRQRLTETNVTAALTAAQQAAAHGVERFLFMSSATVHGTTSRDAAFTEESPLAPQTLYARSKVAAEAGLKEIAEREGLALTVLRPPLVYGPGAKGNLARLLRWAEARRPLPSAVQRNRRDLIGLSNLCRFLEAALREPAAAGETFLVCDGEAISTGTLYERICAAFGHHARFLPVPYGPLALLLRLSGRGALLDRLCGDFRLDSAKARALLGPQAATLMEQDVARMVAHWRAGKGGVPE